MRSKVAAERAYASLRVRGDSLDPEQVTRLLGVFPTIAYAKGMKYHAGERTGELIGKTGVWLLSTKSIIASESLNTHLAFLTTILWYGPRQFEPMIRLHALLAKQKDLRADIACFWHGRYGEKRPSIPKSITELLKLIPADLELDFATDSEDAERRRRA